MSRLITIVIKLLLMSLILSGCRANSSAESTVSEAADFSLYDLQHQWTDQDGARRTLESLAGRPHVIALVYTSCAVSCPRIVVDMKRLEGELGEQAARIGFVMVSIDPARDTPARLHDYAASAHLTAPRWTLLTASDDAILELAVVLGVRYRRISETEMEHSNVLTIVDASGRIVHRQIGLGTDPAESVRVLQSLLAH